MFKQYMGEKVAVATPTKKAMSSVLLILKKEGFQFDSNFAGNWESYGENTGISLDGQSISYCDLPWFRRNGYKILSFKGKIMKPEKINYVLSYDENGSDPTETFSNLEEVQDRIKKLIDDGDNSNFRVFEVKRELKVTVNQVILE